MSDKKQYIFLILIYTASLLFLIGCNDFDSIVEEAGEIDVSRGHVQVRYRKAGPIVKETENGEFTIYPVAKYMLSGIVKSKKVYTDKFKQISPVDLVIVWGKVAEPEYDGDIIYTQRSRWYYYHSELSTEDMPFSMSYVKKHSSNNHIIPANENILFGIENIEEEERIRLVGYLVNVDITYKGKKYTWNSSLKRSDSGSGSCEVFYVTRIETDEVIYE